MLKVCYLIDSLNWGGAQKLVHSFALGAQSEEIALTVAVLRPARPDVPLPKMLQELGVSVKLFPGKGIRDVKRILVLRRWLKDEGFDVLHTHLPASNVVGALAGKGAGVPVVVSLHNENKNSAAGGWLGLVAETFVLRYLVAAIVAVGPRVAAAQQDRVGKTPFITIANAVDNAPQLGEAERKQLRDSLLVDSAGQLLLTVGRLHPQKGYFDLLCAFQKILRSFSKATLAIVGRGSLEADLHAYVADNQISNVKFLGVRADVAQLMAASDLYVNTSHWEGLPVTVLEAMMAQLPVVATSVGDVPLVLGDGRGMLVPAQQPDQFAEAVCAALADKDRLDHMRMSSYNFVQENYNLHAWVTNFMKLYRQVLGMEAV